MIVKLLTIVQLHYCGGTGPAYYQAANYDKFADAKGFIVIYPSTKKDSNCWVSLMSAGGITAFIRDGS